MGLKERNINLNDEVADWEEKAAGLETQIRTLKAESKELKERSPRQQYNSFQGALHMCSYALHLPSKSPITSLFYSTRRSNASTLN